MPFLLEPHVAGELGPASEIDTTTDPPVVSRLQYELDTADADDLIESFPVYLVRAERAGDLAELTGFALAAAEIVPSGMYLDADHPLPPPTYQWLQVHGDADDDFSIGASHTLRVSDRAFARLQRWQLRFCDVQRV